MRPSPLSARHTPHVRIPSALQFDESMSEPDRYGKRHRLISRGARDLWPVLDDLAREHVGVRITAAALCAVLGCSPATLRRYRAELERGGWLRYEVAPGRGNASLWVPLRRARRVRSLAVAEAVDNPADARPGTPCDEAETCSTLSTSDQGNVLNREPLSRVASSTARAREEEEAPGTTASLWTTTGRLSHTTPWCGHCESPEYRWTDSLTEPGRVTRCPSCHPAAELAF